MKYLIDVLGFAETNVTTVAKPDTLPTPVSRFDYVLDGLGRRVERVDLLALTNVFGYNPRSEVVSAVMPVLSGVEGGTNMFGYSYDSIGNRITASTNSTTFTYTANNLNQYTEIMNGGLRDLSYDLDGNLTNDGQWAYTWDGENRMVMAEPLAPTAGAQRVRNAYDYMSRRVEKVVDTWDGTSWVGQSTNQFIYDGWNLICEVRSTLAAPLSTNYYVWGQDLSGTLEGAGGVGGLLAVVQNGATYFPCYDGNGNITDYVDTNGVVVAHREYDAYGNTIVATGPMVNDFYFWFSTKYLDQETGLYYYGYRYYSPSQGRWLSRDPVGEEGFALLLESESFADRVVPADTGAEAGRDASALYLFVRNDPGNHFDPTGLQTASADPCSRCGPDISQPLKSVIWRIRGDFYSWNRVRRWWACRNLDQIPMAFGAWDILELSPRGSPPSRERLNTYCPGCPTPDCLHTVEVDSNCFMASRVNYVQFGTMGNLCGWSLTRTLWLVNMWKTVYGYYRGADRDTTEWTVAGYNGWPRSPTPTTDPARAHCTTDCDPYAGSFSYIWSGSPRRP